MRKPATGFQLVLLEMVRAVRDSNLAAVEVSASDHHNKGGARADIRGRAVNTHSA